MEVRSPFSYAMLPSPCKGRVGEEHEKQDTAIGMSASLARSYLAVMPSNGKL